MRQRLFATLFLVAFFAALPAWFLSTLEGWITLDCVRMGDDAALRCDVQERFAFGSRTTTYLTLSAHVKRREQRDRHGLITSYQLAFATPTGEQQVLSDYTGNTALRQVAADLDAAIRARSLDFHADVSPDLPFWLAVALLVVFAGAGFFIGWSRARSGKRSSRRGS